MPAWATLPRLLELLSLCGMVVAIVPAWSFTRRMRQAHRVARAAAESSGADVEAWRERLVADLKAEAETWKPWHGWCVIAAFALSIVPQLVRVLR
jgi:hypothetical protein